MLSVLSVYFTGWRRPRPFTTLDSEFFWAGELEHSGRFPFNPNSGNFGWYIKWNGPFRFGPTGIFGTSFEGSPLWPVWVFRSVGLKCPFSFDKIVVPSTALLYPAYKRTITTGAVAWVGSMQPECTITLGTWNFRNFKPKFLLNGKRPLLLMKNFPFQK